MWDSSRRPGKREYRDLCRQLQRGLQQPNLRVVPGQFTVLFG